MTQLVRIMVMTVVCLVAACPLSADTVAPAAQPYCPLPTGGFSLLDAVYTTLHHDPNLRLAELSVQSSEGALQAARGTFDLTLTGAASGNLTRTPNTEAAHRASGTAAAVSLTTTVSNSATQQFRNGASATLATDLTRSDNRTRFDVTQPANRSNITFTFTQPLLKGRGGAAAAAGERAAELGNEASRMSYQHTVSEQVYSAVQSYWSYVLAQERLTALRHSEASSLVIIDKTRKLIAAGETPRAELDQLLANYEQNKSSRVSGEASLFEARVALTMAMGLDPRLDTLPATISTLDGYTAEQIGQVPAAERYIALAMARRQDYNAARRQLSVAEVELAAARHDLLPELDLALAAGYSGLDEGSAGDEYLRGYTNGIHGANAAATLSYSWPTANNTAKGTLVMREAACAQQRLTVDNLARTIRNNIITTANAITRGLDNLESSQKAYRFYETAVENEKKKYTLGNSTLLNIISYEDRLTSARLSLLAVQQELAVNITRLRLETGTLVDFADADAARVSVATLTALPGGA